MSSFRSAKTVVRTRDFAASRQFYSSVLGLRIVNEWDEAGGRGCIFSVTPEESGGYLEIYEMTRDDPRYHASFASPFQTDKVDLQLRTDSVDSWTERLKDQWPFDGPEQLPWGQRWITLRDPDNLLIAIYEGKCEPTGSGRFRRVPKGSGGSGGLRQVRSYDRFKSAAFARASRR